MEFMLGRLYVVLSFASHIRQEKFSFSNYFISSYAFCKNVKTVSMKAC